MILCPLGRMEAYHYMLYISDKSSSIPQGLPQILTNVFVMF